MRKVKIIIANDNKNLAELEKKYIEKMDNIDIIGISTTSQEEIELIEKYNPDVVITDILRKNDEISGLDIIKQYENKKDIRFILITASSIDEIIFQNKFILPNNIIRYIKSPFDWNTLCIEIEKALICLRYKLYDESDDYEQRYYSEKIVNLYKELSKNELDDINKDGVIDPKDYEPLVTRDVNLTPNQLNDVGKDYGTCMVKDYNRNYCLQRITKEEYCEIREALFDLPSHGACVLNDKEM